MKFLRRSSPAQILALFIGMTSCTTVLLIFLCNSLSDEFMDHRLHQSYLNHNASEENQLLAKYILVKQSLRQNSELQHLVQSQIDKNRKDVIGNSNIHMMEANLSGVLEMYLRNSADAFVKPAAFKNEFEMVPFTRFSLDRLYPVDPGLGRRVIEKPIGYRKREIQNIIAYAVNSLRRKTGDMVSANDFLEGIYRVIPSIGTQYELYFRDKTRYRKVTIALPNTVPFTANVETVETQKDTVNILLALSQRANVFQQFLQRFRELLQEDNEVHMTVVYFGNYGLAKVNSLVRDFNTHYSSEKVRLLTAPGAFSRGIGLQIAADSLHNNSLMLLCDVDIVLTRSFLERCRLHTSQGYSIYYPIIFSLYNPAIVSQLQRTTGAPDRLVISRDSGFWRDFGYGMTCQYRTDFLSVGGFRDEQVNEKSSAGWGLEDVRLYRKHLHAGRLTVYRATDPGIFHIWHEKICPRTLPDDQFQGCLRSRALGEASQAQLGMLLLRNDYLRGKT